MSIKENEPVYKNYDAGKAEINRITYVLLRGATGSDYAWDVVDSIFEDVVEDVFMASAVDETHDCLDFNTDDVRLAIGRVLTERLEVQS